MDDNNSPKPLKVSELTKLIKQELETDFSNILVEGEISNFKKHSSGHSYFTLKDSGSQVRSALFKGNRRKIRFDPEDGQQVICKGRLSLYEPRGEYSLIVDSMEPKGTGSLQLAFLQLQKKLTAEGLFNDDHKSPLPFLPTKIGIVTSKTGAAVRDIISVLTRRFPNIHIILYPVSVQGDPAAPMIVEAINWFNTEKYVDLLIVGRGGGSLEDLWAFNEEIVARAIFASTIPIISAVGHETDFSISDFVADLRAPTPSAAAEIAVKEKTLLDNGLLNIQKQLAMKMNARITEHRLKFNLVSRSIGSPKALVEKYFLKLDEISYKLSGAINNRSGILKNIIERLQREFFHNAVNTEHLKLSISTITSDLAHSMQSTFNETNSRCNELLTRLSASNPATILKRGYSIPRLNSTGEIIKSVKQIKPGQRFKLTLLNGEINAIACKPEKSYKQKNLFD